MLSLQVFFFSPFFEFYFIQIFCIEIFLHIYNPEIKKISTYNSQLKIHKFINCNQKIIDQMNITHSFYVLHFLIEFCFLFFTDLVGSSLNFKLVK